MAEELLKELEDNKAKKNTTKNKQQTSLPPTVSNGFVMRHIDLNLANRVYQSFADFPVDNEVMEEILKGFEEEEGAYIEPNRPYMSKVAIPKVEGFLDYDVVNDFGGLTDEAYQQRRKEIF